MRAVLSNFRGLMGLIRLLFAGLDDLSHWLQSDLYLGYAVIFLLVFVTTFREYFRRQSPYWKKD